jgi:hypothetical protein
VPETQSDGELTWKLLGKLQPRHALDIEASNWSLGAEMMDRDFNLYKNWKQYLGPLGVKKARIQSGWAKTETVKGVYNFSWLDVIINDMLAQGVHPWVSLSYGNPLYEDGGGVTLNAAVPKSLEAIEAWKNYVRAIVSRYKDEVKEWEVWNEPNYHIATEDYANLFIASAEIIRELQPDATIIAFAIGSGVDYKYVDKVMEIISSRGKISLVDVITHHRHIRVPEENAEELELEKVVATYNPAIRIRQGEGGCPSQWNEGFALNKYPWTETSQAKHISRRLLTDLGRDKESSCFTMIDSRYPAEWNYKGLLRAKPDSTVAYPKPSYYAFQHITSVFDNSLRRIKDFQYTIKNSGGKKVSVYAYSGSTDITSTSKYAITIWFSDNIPSDSNLKTLVDVTFDNVSLAKPVWIDVVSGQIYEIPAANVSRKGKNLMIKHLPIYDSPIIITDSFTPGKAVSKK